MKAESGPHQSVGSPVYGHSGKASAPRSKHVQVIDSTEFKTDREGFSFLEKTKKSHPSETSDGIICTGFVPEAAA